MDLTILDAGVLIAVLNSDDAHHERAREALSTARNRGDRLVVPASAYAEILVAPLRHNAESGDAVDAFLGALPASVEPASREIARRAAELRARHGTRLRLPDALVVATAIVLEAHRVVTTDARWPELGMNVEVIRQAWGEPVAVVVRPDTLRARRASERMSDADRVRDLIANSRQAKLNLRPTLSEQRADELLADVQAARSRR